MISNCRVVGSVGRRRKRRLGNDRSALSLRHSSSFLNLRALWSFLPSSSPINETDTRQLHFPPVVSLYMETVACKHFLILRPLLAKPRPVWATRDPSEGATAQCAAPFPQGPAFLCQVPAGVRSAVVCGCFLNCWVF